MKIISIEGNIGTGKTTFINFLKNNIRDKNIVFLEEPLSEWLLIKDSNGENIMSKFYKNKKRWALSFQINVLFERSRKIINKINEFIDNNEYDNIIIITERSINTDKNIFVNALKDDNDIDQLEYQLFNNWFNWIKEIHNKIIPNYYIYLKANYKKSYERILLRSRCEESNIPIEYIKKLNDNHDSWLLKINNCKIIDLNNDFNYDDKKNDIINIFNDIINRV